MTHDLMDYYIPVRRIVRFYESEINKVLADREYSLGEWPYILMVGRYEGSSIKDLCVRTGVDKGQSTRMVGSLISKGLVENRNPVPRRYSLFLTERGREEYEFAKGLQSDLTDRLLSSLSDEDRASLRRIYSSIGEFLSGCYEY